jgi:hypothetical protein
MLQNISLKGWHMDFENAFNCGVVPAYFIATSFFSAPFGYNLNIRTTPTHIPTLVAFVFKVLLA